MKNQFKKSLSLIMAVFMLMSCWVWVAPTEAEAADVTTQYYVIFKMNVKDTGNENSSSLTINWKYSNGKGSASSTTKSFGQQGWSGDNVVIYEGYINGFPTSVSFTFDIDSTRSERHENYQLLVGKDKASCVTNVIPLDSYEYSGKATYSKSVNADAYPVLSEGGGSLSAESLTLGKVNTTTAATSKLTLSGFKDQYGVAWGDVSYGYSLNAGEGVTLGNHATISKSSNTATVTVNPSFQTLFPGKQSAKLYIPWTASTRSGTATIDVTFPTYTVSFDSNGGKIGASDSDARDKIDVTSNKMNIGSIIGKSPAYRSKDGFDFVGFYSDKNADATGLNANFTGTLFKDDETTVPTQGDMTYYAAWKAEPITATFMTADNQLIGTVEGRYNNTLINTNMYNGLNGLNAAVMASYSGNSVQFDGNNAPIYKDGSSTYTFSHWKIIEGYDNAIVDKDHTATLKGDVTFQAVYTKSDAKKYAVKFYDGNGNVINDASNKSDYKFRDSVIMPATDPSKAQDNKYSYEFIGWANNIGAPYYAIDENDKDASGAVISYTSKDAAEFTVRGDASYVPVFRMTAREYNVTFNYKVDGDNTESVTVGGYHLDDTLKMPEGIKDNYTNGGFRYTIEGWKKGNETKKQQLSDIKVDGDLEVTAVYGSGQGAKYTINFYDMYGELINADSNIYEHNALVTAPSVEETITTPEAQYTFAGFKDKDGNAYSNKATKDVDYYATYAEKIFADVNFYNYDGTLIYGLAGNESTLFVGDAIPAYNEKDYKLPEKAEDPVGTYEFTGWADKDGNEVVPGTDKFSGDIDLFAQFETEYKEYTVKFLNDDGSVVSEKKYHYATEIEIPANPEKKADETFKYEFKGWTPAVSEVCYGDATYVATYRRAYNYYTVNWLNEIEVNEETGEKIISTYSTSNYTYDAKISPAVISKTGDIVEAGKEWKFKHWVQCDANGDDVLVDGKQVIFTRGMKMPAAEEGIYFYPVFEMVDKVITVTFYNQDGSKKLGSAEFDYSEADITNFDADFINEAIPASNKDYHYTVDKFVTVNAETNEETEVTVVEEDIAVRVIFKEEEHSKSVEHILVDPTCNVIGYAEYICSKEGCGQADTYIPLTYAADKTAPAGQIYIGGKKWKSGDAVDYNEITYISPNTQFIANTYDLGDEGSILSRGVGKVEYYVHNLTKNNNNRIEDMSSISGWVEFYNYENLKKDILAQVLAERKIEMADYVAYHNEDADGEDKLTMVDIDREVEGKLTAYKANATAYASSLELEDGDNYIIYLKISDTDPDGNLLEYGSNVAYINSGIFSYGSKAATVDVSGSGFGTKFCETATIAVSDDNGGYEVSVDGTVQNVTITANDNGSYTAQLDVSSKGVHTVTVTDIHGNKTTKTFEVKGGHTYKNYTVAATCENSGSRYDLCTVCGIKSHITEIPAKGHSYTDNFTDKAPTCVVDGKRTYICDNNCGIKLELVFDENHNLDAVEVAKAMKYNAETEEWSIPLTVEDLAHLKATGVHTYAKVKDEAGNETEEDQWVIDRAAKCTEPGAKHKNCTKCGFRVDAEIVDAEAHKFYRASETTPATCTQQGIKTKTCRYCQKSVFVENTPALGHTDGEYVVTKAATCEEAGSKNLLCATCGEVLKTEEIAALGHAYVLTDDEVYEENGKYYQNYVCLNDSTHTKKEEVPGYEPPVAATVTFKNGDAEYQVISSTVGNTISASQIKGTPAKAADKTYTYTFAGWEDTAGNAVKFPIDVKGDATYTAKFDAKYINYTITYYKEIITKLEDGSDSISYEQVKKTGYLHNCDVVTLAEGPAKAENYLESYTFAGWKNKNTNEVYTDNTVTIDGAGINLVATYTAVSKKYVVTYAYSMNDTIMSYDVTAGTEAPDVADEGFVAEKNYDTKYHYNFKEWNKTEDLKEVKYNIYTTPVFTPVEHDYAKTLETAATCTSNAVYRYTCDCGYSYTKVETNSVLGHNWSTPVYDSATGKVTVTCQNENCGKTEENSTKYTVKYFTSIEDEKAIETVSHIKWGSKLTFIPQNPSKAETETHRYEFKGWAEILVDEEGNKSVGEIVDLEALTVKRDYNLVAVFDKFVKEYTVIFAYDANNKIATYYNVPATVVADEDALFACYQGATPAQVPDAKGHYEFSGWHINDKQKASVTVYADFTKHEHTLIETTLDEATCTTGEGVRSWCNCNGNTVDGVPVFDAKVDGKYVDYYTETTSKPLGHDYVLNAEKSVAATPNADGYDYYECSRCDATDKKPTKYNDNKMYIMVEVLHNGAAESNVKVEIRDKSTNTTKFVTTNKEGVATLEGIKGNTYTAFVTIGSETIEVKLEADAEGNLTATYNHIDKQVNCSCACHRDNVWGMIFRFFHKIIKLFTGEFKCCGNPDPMYG